MDIKAQLRQKLYDRYSDLDIYIYARGGLLVFVGGIIRDSIVSIPTKDADIECYCLEKEKLAEILSQKYIVKYVGASFGVFKLANLNIDIALPRTDKCVGYKHTSFEVSINVFSSYKQSAMRRDLTINSIGYCLQHNLVLDPFNGIADIKSKTIHPVNADMFLEDPLRLLRSVYFAAKMSFSFSDVMKSLYLNNIHLISNISVERISDENKKILSCKNFMRYAHYLSLVPNLQFDVFRKLIAISDEQKQQLTTIYQLNVKLAFIYTISTSIIVAIQGAIDIHGRLLSTISYVGQIAGFLCAYKTFAHINLFYTITCVYKHRLSVEVMALLDDCWYLFSLKRKRNVLDSCIFTYLQYLQEVKHAATHMVGNDLKIYITTLYNQYKELFVFDAA